MARGGHLIGMLTGVLRTWKALRKALQKIQILMMDNSQAERRVRAVRLLEAWAEWQRHYRINTGFPRRSCGIQCFGQVVTDDSSDEQQSEAERMRCEVVDQCIDDLPVPAQRAAIHHRYLNAVYRMRDYEIALDDALSSLVNAFIRKGILW